MKVGIIYKFTVLTTKHFYVGQTTSESVDKFLESYPSLSKCYWGSGSAIWKHVLVRLIKKFPSNWNKLIKREVLEHFDEYDQTTLNSTERRYIKSEKSHYSYGMRGCNFLWGEARGDDWINAMKIPEIRKKVSEKNKISMKGVFAGDKHPLWGKGHSEETKRKMSESRKGVKLSEEHLKSFHSHIHLPKTEEHKKKIGDSQRGEKSVHFGKKLSNKHKKKVSLGMRKYYKENDNPNRGKKWITDGEQSKKHDPTLPLPEGWYYGRTI